MVTAKIRSIILGLVAALILVRACTQATPTPVPDTPFLTAEDVIGLVSTFIFQTGWNAPPINSTSPPIVCGDMENYVRGPTRSSINKAEEDATARNRGQQVWIVKFSDCGTFLVNDRTGIVASP